MRLSMQKEDTGYRNLAGVRITVFIDGVEAKRVLTADEEAGYIVVCSVNEEGRVFIKDGEIQTEIRRGKVEIVLPDGYEFLRGDK